MTNALGVLNIAIKADPKSGEPWVAKGLTYRSNDDPTNATAAFRQALKLEPTHFGALRALTETLFSQNDTNSVVALLDQAFRQPSKDANYWMVLGDMSAYVVRQKPSSAVASTGPMSGNVTSGVGLGAE